MFMNQFDISMAMTRHHNDGQPNRTQAAIWLDDLRIWTDNNSDGWAYWPKPSRAAKRLMELAESRNPRTDCTDAELSAALRPVKAFLTRHGVDHHDVLSPLP